MFCFGFVLVVSFFCVFGWTWFDMVLLFLCWSDFYCCIFFVYCCIVCIVFLVLCCIVLYCIALHCIALHCIVLYCIVFLVLCGLVLSLHHLFLLIYVFLLVLIYGMPFHLRIVSFRSTSLILFYSLAFRRLVLLRFVRFRLFSFRFL